MHKDSRYLLRPASLIALALATSSVFAQYKSAIAPPSEFKAGFDAVSVDLARQHLNYLAGPECFGRGTGQPGYQKAAEYVAARFKEMGLVPIGDGGTYFQGSRSSVSPWTRPLQCSRAQRVRFGSEKGLV